MIYSLNLYSLKKIKIIQFGGLINIYSTYNPIKLNPLDLVVNKF